MKKKVISAILCAAMVGTMVVGCGKQDAGNSTSTPDSVSTPVEDSTTPDPEPEGGKTITYWSMWDAGSNQAIAIQEAIDAYQTATGNTVNVEWKGRDITNLIGAAIDAGEAIDIYEDDFQRLSTAGALGEYALALDDMAAAAGYAEKSNGALTSAVQGWAGSLACIPYQPYASGVFYNKAIFEEVGVSEPTTWAEFLDVCQKIKDAGYNPLTVDDAYINLNLGYHLARYVGQDGAKEIVNDGLFAENPGFLKMAQDMEALISAGYMSEYAPGAYPECENEVGYGETAMLVNASWVPDEITGNTGCDLEWGMFSYPGVEGGVDGPEGMMVGAQGMAINKNSANAQEAFDLIMYITTGEFDAAISSATNSIPADPNNTEWPAIIQSCKAAFEGATKGYEWDCGIDDNANMTAIIKDWGAKLLSGDCTAQEFVDGLEAEYVAPPTK